MQEVLEKSKDIVAEENYESSNDTNVTESENSLEDSEENQETGKTPEAEESNIPAASESAKNNEDQLTEDDRKASDTQTFPERKKMAEERSISRKSPRQFQVLPADTSPPDTSNTTDISTDANTVVVTDGKDRSWRILSAPHRSTTPVPTSQSPPERHQSERTKLSKQHVLPTATSAAMTTRTSPTSPTTATTSTAAIAPTPLAINVRKHESPNPSPRRRSSILPNRLSTTLTGSVGPSGSPPGSPHSTEGETESSLRVPVQRSLLPTNLYKSRDGLETSERRENGVLKKNSEGKRKGKEKGSSSEEEDFDETEEEEYDHATEKDKGEGSDEDSDELDLYFSSQSSSSEDGDLKLPKVVNYGKCCTDLKLRYL